MTDAIWPPTGYQSRARPWTSPKAQLSAVMVTSSFAFIGTLTVTGAKPMLQQLPGNFVFTSTSPVFASLMVNAGEEPSGRKLPYSSPELPK